MAFQQPSQSYPQIDVSYIQYTIKAIGTENRSTRSYKYLWLWFAYYPPVGGGVILNANSVGNYCGFNGGTLLGNKNAQQDRPTLGDYVSLGPGAKVIGKVVLGDNVFVAANAVVTKDVPANSIVGGIPAKVIKERSLADNKVYQHFNHQ